MESANTKEDKAQERRIIREKAIADSISELRGKYPQLESVELRKLAILEMRKKALERQAQRVLNPRINSKVDTKRKVLVGALILNEVKTNQELRKLVRRLIGTLKEADQKIFADLMFMANPTPQAPIPPSQQEAVRQS